MKERISRKVKSLSPSGIRAFFEYASGVPGILSLGVGEPDFVTPKPFLDSAISSLTNGKTQYTSNFGLLELREEIVRHTEKIGGPKYNPKTEVCVTVRVSEGVDIAMRALLDEGDEVILADPGYVSYEPMIKMAGGVPVFVATDESNGFRLSAESIQAAVTPKTKVLLLAYPANPTGMSIPGDTLKEIAEIVKANDILVVSDEIYDRLTFEGEHTVFSSIEGMKERTIYLNGFSKAYAMTGWRVGYVCAHEDLIEAMMKVHQYSIMCAPTMAQYAALEALRSGWGEMEKMVASYKERRDLIKDLLSDVGFPMPMPDGAFYAFPSIASTGLSSDEFCQRLLKEQKVVAVPGSAFGKQGEGHIRLCYAASVETLKEAFERMKVFLEGIKG